LAIQFRPLDFIATKSLNYLAFQCFDFEHIWRRLFQKNVVLTKFDIYVFVTACEESHYGQNCTGICQCSKNSHCDHVTGKCNCNLGQLKMITIFLLWNHLIYITSITTPPFIVQNMGSYYTLMHTIYINLRYLIHNFDHRIQKYIHNIQI
jgi:hypothetical protein